MNYVDEEMDFPWPTEPPRDSDESREKDMCLPLEYQLHPNSLTTQQTPRAKKSMFKKLTGIFRSNNTSPTTPPVPLPSSDDAYASTPSSADSSGPNDPYANILSSAAGIPDPLLPPPPPSPFMEPRKSSSSSRSLFLNGLFTRSQETLTPPPSKKERNVLRKKGSASSLRAMRNGNGNGSTTSLAKSVKEVTKKKSGLAMEIKVPPPPTFSQQRPPDLLLSPTTPDYRDEDTSTPTPSSLPPTPASPSPLSKSPSIRRPPRPLASLPPAPPSPTFPPPPPPPFQHSELPPRRDSLLLPPSPSSPYLSSFPQPPPSPPSVRVQHPSPEKPPSLTSSSSSSGGGVTTTTTTTTPSDSIDNGRPSPHHIKSTVLPRLKDPFKQIRYRQDIEEDPDQLLLSDMEVGLSRNWTTFANESTERFRAAVVEEDEEGEDAISMISNNEGGGKGKKGHKIGKLSNKPTSEKPKSSLFRKRNPPPSPLTLSPSLSTYSSSSALPSPLLLTPPAPHSPIRPLVQALEDIDIEDVENDTVPKGNYHYAKTTEQQRGGGRVVVARRFDL